MASNNIAFDDTAKPGNNNSSTASNLWVSVSADSDDVTISEDGSVLERKNGLSKQHSNTEESTLPLVSQHSPPRGDREKDKDKRSNNNTNKLIKKGGSKIVAAIKSLQCSPRVDASDYGKLKEKKKNKGSSNNNNNGNNNESIATDVRHNLSQQPQESTTSKQEELIFVANFDNFANFESVQDQLPVVEKDSVSNHSELEDVLENIDASDILQIFTTNTNDTEDTIDNNDESRRKNGQKNEKYAAAAATDDDDDDDNQIIHDLRNTISGLSQNETDFMAKTYSSAEVSGCNVNVKADGSTPTSRSSSPSSSKPKRMIQNEFSQYSNDSNDTPVTCNKSLILTPKNNNDNNERLHYGRKEEQQQNSGDDDNDFWCLPPKEVLHTSLSLGDAISPTEGDNSPCPPDQDQSRRNKVSAEPSYGKASKKSKEMSTIDPQQHTIETLKLPVMNGTRGGTSESILRRVQQFEKQQAGGISYISKYATEGISTAPQEGDDVSAVSSSYVSSFVFSTSENSHNLDGKAIHHHAVVNSDPTSPSHFWKTQLREHEKRGMRQQQKAVNNHYAVINSEQPTSPAFFWKTHPRVTIRSYHFQQRKASNIRKVNARLEIGRPMMYHATSAQVEKQGGFCLGIRR